MRKLIAALVVAVFAVTACGGGAEKDGASEAPADGALAGSEGAALLRFRATTLDGRPFDGGSLAGKPVVLWFWAPWCPTCQGEGPAVAATARKYADRVAVLGVAGLDKSKEQMQAFVSRTGTSDIVHLDDRTGALYKHFKVTAQSSYLLVNPEGGTQSAVGPLSEADLSELIEQFAL